VPKRVLPAERYCIPVLRHAALHARTAISRLNRGGGVPEQRANSVLLRHFAEVWRARSRPPSLRAVVVNHARNREAHELVQALRAHVPALAIDSGSTFAAGEEAWFDLRLPNVFYSGLFNAAVAACADLADDDVLYFVCSDVSVPDAGRALERTRIAFADPRIGVYGASAQGTSFSTMRNRGSGGLRELPFVEGFCFAARMSVLRAVAPVDTALNTLGWGIDIHLAFAARVAGLRCVVDDAVQVTHDMGSGYSQEEALAQMKAWFAAQPAAVQLGQRLIFRSWAQTRLGTLYLQVFPWARWYARQMQQVAP
jgi:hypothetical protein